MVVSRARPLFSVYLWWRKKLFFKSLARETILMVGGTIDVINVALKIDKRLCKCWTRDLLIIKNGLANLSIDFTQLYH